MSDSLTKLLAPNESRDLTWEEVGHHLKRTVLSDAECKNRDEAALRQELYRAEGDEHVGDKVLHVFKDPEVRQYRKDWIRLGKFDNVWKSYVNAKATVYNVPAVRKVGGKTDQERYETLQRQCRQNAMAKIWNRWGYLQRSLAVGFRVRKRTQKPVIDVVSRDSFWALGHPDDPTDLIAMGIRIAQPNKDLASWRESEKWQVWTDHERFVCDGGGHVKTETIHKHGWARMPWLLFSIEPPVGRLIDHSTGKENDAAHLAVWFEHICGLKESKSATKIPVVSGDTTRDARAQAADSEIPVELRDGTSLSAIDMGMDFSKFRDHADFIKTTSAANEGIAPNILKHEGVQSAQARELMRAPLMELRREQEDYLREFEREFVEIQAMVVERDLNELKFSTAGWSIDFQDSRIPLDPKASTELFEHKRRLGLTSTIQYLREQNPDLSVAQAKALLVRLIADEFTRNTLMRPLQQISGSMGADPPAEGETPPAKQSNDVESLVRSVLGS